MLLKHPLRCVASLMLALAAANFASGQQLQPFIEPDYFGPDFQFFAPAELSDFGGRESGTTGFFAQYSRTYVSVSRPDSVAPDGFGIPGAVPFATRSGPPWTPTFPPFGINGQFGPGADFGWGNRYDLGYMTQDDHGWWATFTDLNGPNATIVTPQESLARFIGGTGAGGGGGAATVQNPDIYDLTQTLNAANYRCFELSKTWRLDPLHNGTVVEPLVGAHYREFRDIYRHDEYDRYANLPAAIPPGINFPNLLIPAAIGPNEVYATRHGEVLNQMLGGQLGMRFAKKQGHWTFSGDMKAFADANWQYATLNDKVRTITYTGLGGTISSILNSNSAYTQQQTARMVWGGELRGDVNFQLTRDISLQFGGQYLHFANNIGRSATNFAAGAAGGQVVLADRNNDVVMLGISMGVTVNR